MYIKEIPQDAVKIKNALEYIDKKGNVYGVETRKNNPNKGKFFIKAQNKVHGYKYVGINYKDKRITKRVHRLVAEAFIPNPENLPIVMHLNNKKDDNRVENLKWGTIQENTKQAFDDGLIKNDSGFQDSQSIPCDCYDTLTNVLIKKYGSISEASKDTGITKTGIRFHMLNPNILPKKTLYFVEENSGPVPHPVTVMYDYNTDEEIKRFVSIGKASLETGIGFSTIQSQVFGRHKPKWVKNGVYFKNIIV